ncbi:MAG: type III-B CRISPR module-associated Cmr3 family protein, partial [Desulfoplanes sp.]
MKSHDLDIIPRDPLVLRDGRPFGQSGVATTGAFLWPRPGTVIGMVRSYIGKCRDTKYFDRPCAEHIQEIKKIRLEAFTPYLDEKQGCQLCYPAPADAIAFPVSTQDNSEMLDIKPIRPTTLDEDEGTDISHTDWMYPWINDPRKPASMPLFWRWDYMKEWLEKGSLSSSRGFSPKQLGIVSPEESERTHIAIDKKTGATEESKLFTSSGIEFSQPVGIATRIGLADEDKVPERDMAVLGADRGLVGLRWAKKRFEWPTLPRIYDDIMGLRLILRTPGLFKGGWVPEWLKPSLNGSWITAPGTDYQLR